MGEHVRQGTLLGRAVESAKEAICITDLRDRFVFVNEGFRRLYGYSNAQILGKTPALLFSPRNPPGLFSDILAGTRLGGWRGTVLDRRKDGTEFPVLLSTSPVRDGGGRLIGLRGMAQEVPHTHGDPETFQGRADQRRRLGQDLHDGLGQLLTGIALRAKALEQSLASQGLPQSRDAHELSLLMRKAIEQSRALARGLESPGSACGSISKALENLAAEATHLFNVECQLVCQGSHLRCDAQTRRQFYRIAQEAIHNAVRHGQARRIELRLVGNPDFLCVCISDDGLGFSTKSAHSAGMGLRNMEERSHSVGAALSIRSQPGQGTEVRCLKIRRNKCPLRPGKFSG